MHAQRAAATSGLNVRSGQSTSARIIDHLAAGDTVTLLSASPRLGYFHVVTPSGTKGWAWAARVRVVAATAVPPPVRSRARGAREPSDGPTVAPGSLRESVGYSPAASLDASWSKVASNAVDYTWTDIPHSVCPAAGVGGDTETNRWKNRTDSAESYHEVSWSALATLEFPHNSKKHRSDWSTADLAEIGRSEGLPISVVGFLSGLRVETPGTRNGVAQKGESTNCGENQETRVDWHMYLTAAPHESHFRGIVIETTPRVRPFHTEWDTTRVKLAVAAGDSVRVSGWLMVDPEHWDQMYGYLPGDTLTVRKARITLWEIHPVTRIEIRRNGSWVGLDR